MITTPEQLKEEMMNNNPWAWQQAKEFISNVIDTTWNAALDAVEKEMPSEQSPKFHQGKSGDKYEYMNTSQVKGFNSALSQVRQKLSELRIQK